MVRIRLRRVGLKRQPSYRIVVADQRTKRDGRFIEIIGHHNPRTRPNTDIVEEERALYWLSNGAQPSESVKRIFVRTGTWERYERLRKGEELEALVAEAEAALAEAAPVSAKTRYAAPGPGESKQKAREADAVAGAEDVWERNRGERLVDTHAVVAEAQDRDGRRRDQPGGQDHFVESRFRIVRGPHDHLAIATA